MRWPAKLAEGRTSAAMFNTIDLLPTHAALLGAELPKHKIDGLDVWPLIAGQEGAKNPHDGYAFYYENNQLQDVVTADGRWNLQLPHTYRTLAGRPGGKDGIPAKYEPCKLDHAELYDLQGDIRQRKDVAAGHPDIVKQLEAFAEKTRADLGDRLTKREGNGLREPGRVSPAAQLLEPPCTYRD